VHLTVVGGGLAGSEAAWQAAERDVPVLLYEMRPEATTPAHATDLLAELVCSNSLGAKAPDRAVGLLKAEMKLIGSLIIDSAEETAVPAGGALAVDREAFARLVTERISQHPLITLVRQEVEVLPDGPVVVATGPLTSEAMSRQIEKMTGAEYLHFYDAMAPIVEADTIDMSVAYRASRYDRGEQEEGDYINCPMSQGEYEAFVDALLAAEVTPLREFEQQDERFFEACLPVEVLAARGRKALAFGPLRPVGLVDPRTGQRPYAVVQLRQDNLAASLFNIVGFQTNLRWADQERVFRMIPGLQDAEYVRFGQMHRNTYINAPNLLAATLQLRSVQEDALAPPVWMAGQITGTEGYVGSAMGGMVAGVNAARTLRGAPQIVFPETTMMGALLHYVSHAEADDFQPMKANFGLLPPLGERVRGRRDRYRAYADRALEMMHALVIREGLSAVGRE
jgi:methylenetetrahydrofolate--tRNA-(uracil-5-)-methyltransferase